MPSTRKSQNGCAQDGAVTTTKTAATAGSNAVDPAAGASKELEPIASCMTPSVPELTTAAPGTQSATLGAAGSAEPAAPGAAECDFFLGFFVAVGAAEGCEPA